jgi:hypothetical protein
MSARRSSLSVCRRAGTLLRAQLPTTAGIVPRPVRDAVGLTRLGRWWQRLASRHCPLLAGAAAPGAHDLVLTRCRGGCFCVLAWATVGLQDSGPDRTPQRRAVRPLAAQARPRVVSAAVILARQPPSSVGLDVCGNLCCSSPQRREADDRIEVLGHNRP